MDNPLWMNFNCSTLTCILFRSRCFGRLNFNRWWLPARRGGFSLRGRGLYQTKIMNVLLQIVDLGDWCESGKTIIIFEYARILSERISNLCPFQLLSLSIIIMLIEQKWYISKTHFYPPPPQLCWWVQWQEMLGVPSLWAIQLRSLLKTKTNSLIQCTT